MVLPAFLVVYQNASLTDAIENNSPMDAELRNEQSKTNTNTTPRFKTGVKSSDLNKSVQRAYATPTAAGVSIPDHSTPWGVTKKRYSVLRRCVTFPTLVPLWLWIPICAPTYRL